MLKPDSEDPVYMVNMKKIMLDDLKERVADNLNGKFLLKATALDPRFKNLKMVETKTGREGIFTEIESELREHSKETEDTNHTKKTDKDETDCKKRKYCLDFDESDEVNIEDGDCVKKELDTYRKEAVPGRDEDPLAWWRSRKAEYPNLVRLVR